MREWELLAHIRASSADQPGTFPHVIIPPGDDCGVVRTPAGDQILLKVDQVVEGRHFRAPGSSWHSADGFPGGLSRAAYLDLIARKAVARAISDIAAMAGSPLSALAAACLPSGFPDDAARELADGLHRWGAHWSCPVVGGDLASFSAEHAGPLTLAISVVGLPHPARGPVLRSGARSGDLLYTTGSIGGSLRADGLGKHLTFEPRLREARHLADTLGPRLHAMLDVSDGLGVDAARLATASHACVEIEEARLPTTPGVPARRAVRDGEDYELLFTAHPAAEVPRRVPGTDCPITCIGEVVPGPPGAALLRMDGGREDVSRSGWEHT
ncbi:thiamine-monophosphate kinase [Phycisphaerales bacterium]|nr:thiamine-monophosphate kinase [Phycisphaerales bacterium]